MTDPKIAAARSRLLPRLREAVARLVREEGLGEEMEERMLALFACACLIGHDSPIRGERMIMELIATYLAPLPQSPDGIQQLVWLLNRIGFAAVIEPVEPGCNGKAQNAPTSEAVN